ncbi:MAG TPA: 2,3-bisphosphoglycerate-independent phosphoglycerate mutase [Terriglobales bacterium]|nr:2,3-bisphosphoglycerate-independent phosphoglycerate mutase [Terriglobales bacterium]
MSASPVSKPLVLVILDGWGCAPAGPGNAIALARKPVYDRLKRDFPHTRLLTSGPAVGLPEGQMGNSEVGHLNIGAGRIVQMDSTRLDLAIADGSLGRNPALLGALRHARGRQLHLLGLCSDGGVHSHLNHLYALLRLAKAEGVERAWVHAFTDGRDTPPHSGREYLEQLEQKLREIGLGAIATVSGRYYAMDRDQRWERIQLALDAIVHGAGPRAASAAAALTASYERGVTDEFVVPTVLAGPRGERPLATLRDDDAVIFFNFRADRARQMTRALTRAGEPLPALEAAIPRSSLPQRLHYLCMTRYDKTFDLPLVLSPEPLNHILAQVMAERGLRNLRVAETEKYAHVTYFFNGGVEAAFPGEERKLVPSPKVATYDLMPEMAAAGVAAAVVGAIESGSFDVIVANFANADMVGHSGQIAPTVRAVETVDACLGEIERALRRRGGALLVTADHGNAEQMLLPDGGAHTFHTTNPVPLLLVAEPAAGQPPLRLRPDGSLRDLAPTLLGMLQLPEPPEMTGHDLRIP